MPLLAVFVATTSLSGSTHVVSMQVLTSLLRAGHSSQQRVMLHLISLPLLETSPCRCTFTSHHHFDAPRTFVETLAVCIQLDNAPLPRISPTLMFHSIPILFPTLFPSQFSTLFPSSFPSLLPSLFFHSFSQALSPTISQSLSQSISPLYFLVYFYILFHGLFLNLLPSLLPIHS
jgi:hypothetical protein